MEFVEAFDGGRWTFLAQLPHLGAIIVNLTLEHDTCTLECSVSFVLSYSYKCSLQVACKGLDLRCDVGLPCTSHINRGKRASSFIFLLFILKYHSCVEMWPREGCTLASLFLESSLVLDIYLCLEVLGFLGLLGIAWSILEVQGQSLSLGDWRLGFCDKTLEVTLLEKKRRGLLALEDVLE